MIKNIIFDMGNVLLRYDPDYMLSFFTDDTADRALLKNAIFQTPDWLSLDRGTIDEAKAYAGMCKSLPERLYPLCADVLMNWHRHFDAIGEMYGFALKMKQKGYRLYVLSNAHQSFWQYFTSKPVCALMDGIVLSSDVKLLKPDEEIYRLLFKNFSLVPDECFFIDDTEINVETGRKLGMKGYVFDGNIEALEKEIESC